VRILGIFQQLLVAVKVTGETSPRHRTTSSFEALTVCLKQETRTTNKIFSSQIRHSFSTRQPDVLLPPTKRKTTRVPKNPNRLYSLFLNHPAQ